MTDIAGLREAMAKANSQCPEGSFGTDAHRYWLNGVHGARIMIVGMVPDLLTDLEAAQSRIAKLEEGLHQYRNDMLYPPAPDSRERRVAMIDNLLSGEK